MNFDYSKLFGKIREKYKTQAAFADAMGMSRTSLNQRLNNVLDFSQGEMEKAAELLGFPKNRIPEYFFTVKVQKTELRGS